MNTLRGFRARGKWEIGLGRSAHAFESGPVARGQLSNSLPLEIRFSVSGTWRGRKAVGNKLCVAAPQRNGRRDRYPMNARESRSRFPVRHPPIGARKSLKREPGNPYKGESNGQGHLDGGARKREIPKPCRISETSFSLMPECRRDYQTLRASGARWKSEGSPLCVRSLPRRHLRCSSRYFLC